MENSETKTSGERAPEELERTREENRVTGEKVISLANGFANRGEIIHASELYRRQYAPKPETFAGIDGMTADEIAADQKVVEFLSKRDEADKLKKADSAFAELLVIEGINGANGGEDWFYDAERFGEEAGHRPITAIPTAEIDDRCGHVDIVAVAKNDALFGGEAIPFAIDVTIRDKYSELMRPGGEQQWRNNVEKSDKKFGWIHMYGKAGQKKGEPTRNPSQSEFDRRIYGPAGERSNGLKIPGFASVKYYEDTSSPEPIREKGRIYVMPRFVVGFEGRTLEVLRKGEPKETDNSDPMQFLGALREYGEEITKARWCVVMEIAQQAKDIDNYVSNLTEAEIAARHMDPAELAEARKQIRSLRTYFEDAVRLGEEKAKRDNVTRFGMKLADNDVVLATIANESARTYERQNVSVAAS